MGKKMSEDETLYPCGTCGHKPPTHKRLGKDKRRVEILNAAIELAKDKGYTNIMRGEVAEKAGVSHNLIHRYFGGLTDLKQEIMQHAVEEKILEIIAQGLLFSDPIAESAPVTLRAQAMAELKNYV